MGNVCSTQTSGNSSEFPEAAKLLAAKRSLLPRSLKNYAECEIIRDESQQYSLEEKEKLIKSFGKETEQWASRPETAQEKQFVVEHILSQLEKANEYKVNTEVKLKKHEVQFLVQEAKQIFINREKSLLELEAPICICGDFHG